MHVFFSACCLIWCLIVLVGIKILLPVFAIVDLNGIQYCRFKMVFAIVDLKWYSVLHSIVCWHYIAQPAPGNTGNTCSGSSVRCYLKPCMQLVYSGLFVVIEHNHCSCNVQGPLLHPFNKLQIPCLQFQSYVIPVLYSTTLGIPVYRPTLSVLCCVCVYIVKPY